MSSVMDAVSTNAEPVLRCQGLGKTFAEFGTCIGKDLE